LLHAVIRRNDRKKNTVRLRNKWVAVDPQEWKRRNDMTVHVGVGTGGKAEQLMFLLQLLNIQKEAVLSGSGLATVKNLFNTLTKIVEMAGLKSVAPYFEDPEGKPPPQPPPDPKMMAVQAKAKADQAKQQADMMLAQQDAALDKEKMEREFQLKVEQLQAEMALKREQLAAELALKRQQIAFSAQVSMATSQVRMGGKPG
ncbi:MAG: hypothetical protein Q7R45_12955, partial [Sulfuricaulis sp.]|nr:hypothetical protein [Sulfuricaulis sp.]